MGVEHCAKLVGKFPHAKLVAVGEPGVLVPVGVTTEPGSVTEFILLLVVVDEVEIVDVGRVMCAEPSI